MTPAGFVQRYNAWIGLVGTVITILGAAYALRGPDTGAIYFRTKTLSVAQSADMGGSLKILDKNGNRIQGNVYADDVVIWNAGSFTLGSASDRIREPLTLSIDAKIIDSFIQNTNTPKDDVSLTSKSDREIQVKWTQFDPGDAIHLIVIYEANAISPLTVSGKFVGTRISDFSDFSFDPKRPQWSAQLRELMHRKPIQVFGIVIFALGLLFVYAVFFSALGRMKLFYPNTKTDPLLSPTKRIVFTTSLVAVALGLILLSIGSYMTSATPPF